MQVVVRKEHENDKNLMGHYICWAEGETRELGLFDK